MTKITLKQFRFDAARAEKGIKMSPRKKAQQPCFDVTPDEGVIIRKIVQRMRKEDPNIDVLSATMDIMACHASGNPLKLEQLLAADDFNFNHDAFGISRHIDRETGLLLNHFSPRYSVPERELKRGPGGYLRRRAS